MIYIQKQTKQPNMKKTIIALLLMASATFAQTRFRTTALDTIPQRVSAGFTNVATMNIAYPATAIVYVKFYDTKLRPNPAVDSPVITLQVGTDATLSYKLQSYDNVKFRNGLWVRCVTGISDTARTAAQPATKPVVEITY